MIEIIIMIGVVGWFNRTAKSMGKNGVLWGIIGALSYYVPVIIFGWFIYPGLVKNSVTYDNLLIYKIAGIVINVLIGAMCCFLARNILLSSVESTVRNNSTAFATEEPAAVLEEEEEFVCSSCNHTVLQSDPYCKNCGAKL